MAEFSAKLAELLKAKGWDKVKGGKEKAASQLDVSRASFYNYLNKNDLPSFEVLKRAYEKWGMTFEHIDFGSARSSRHVPSEEESPRQYVLPFLQAVRGEDVEVVRAKTVKPDTLQLTVNIRFAG